jgi:Protein of unknown function (DUF998)
VKRQDPTITKPARSAIALITVFAVVVVILHFVQGGHYHPMSEAVSELALGRDGWLMTIAFCCLGTGTILTAVALRRSLLSRPRVAPAMLALSGMLSYVSAFAHADPSSSNISTTHGAVHQLAGVATFLLIIGCMFSLVRTLRRDRTWRAMAIPTLIWGIAALAAFAATAASSDAYFGLDQRLFLGLALSWILTIAARAYRLPSRHGEPRATAPDSTATRIPTRPRKSIA